MARKINVDVNELIEQWRIKTNTLANQVGELDDLGDSAANIVAALNAINDSSDTGPITARTQAMIDSNNNLRFPVVTADIKDSAVTTVKIKDLNVTTSKFAAGAVDSDALGANAIQNTHIANDQIISRHYADSSIEAAHIKQNQITSREFNGLVTFTILSDSGTTLKSIFGPGS